MKKFSPHYALFLVLLLATAGCSPTPASTNTAEETPLAMQTSTPTNHPVRTATFTDTPMDTPTGTYTTLPTLPSGSTWTRPVDGMVMVHVPAGEFEMGSTEGYADESPVHTVYLDAFWIDRTEVSNAQYALCVAAGACEPPQSEVSGTRETYYSGEAFPNYPVIYVTWEQSQAYCAWAGGRLPTEAEWEKAARGTQGNTYPWGEAFDCHLGNFDDETYLDELVVPGGPNCDGYMDTSPVGSFPSGASPYGLLDMAGNVWEWVNDWSDTEYYSQSPAGNPTGPASGIERVVRGGSWFNGEVDVRTTYRGDLEPDSSSAFAGFRCVQSSVEP